jgi:hypothetical protein
MRGPVARLADVTIARPTPTSEPAPTASQGDGPEVKSGLRWFSGHGCVMWKEDSAEVFVGGSLIGRFTRGEYGVRNAILIGLAQDPQVHYGRLAKAFDITSETLRLIRRLFETEGLEAVLARAPGGCEK